jgi:ribosomal protein S1
VDYGGFAEVEPGIEGLLHLSQLSRGNVERADEVVKEGETHLLRVVSIDRRRQRMGLSLKAVTTTEQIEWMAQRELEKAEEAAAEPALVDDVDEVDADESGAEADDIDEMAKAAVDALADESGQGEEE